MATNKPLRRPNFTQEEITTIVTEVNLRSNILLAKYRGDGASDNSITKNVINKAWREVTDAVNAVGGNNREVGEVIVKHKNYKSKTRSVNAENMREMQETGGGTAELKPLDATQMMVLESIPKAALTGIEGGIDINDIRPKSGDNFLSKPCLQLVLTKESNASSSMDITQYTIPVSEPTQGNSSRDNTGTTAPKRLHSGSDSQSTPKYKRKRMEISITESLMSEQVESVNRQVDVLHEIKDLMKSRNEIELQKLELIRSILRSKESQNEENSEHGKESGSKTQANTLTQLLKEF